MKTTEIIEVVFERLQLERIVDFLAKESFSSTLKDYQISTDSPVAEINLRSSEMLFKNIDGSSDGAFYFNFIDFNFNDFLLSKLGIQVYKYNNTYDLNLHVEKNELSQKTSISNFHAWVESIALELKASDYYCGFEPAIDMETRYFSGSKLGPLKDW